MNSLSPLSATNMVGARIGVLLVNLGSPSGTDYVSMRRYLKEFLSDRRVIETPRFIWWPILNLIILSTRPSRSGKKYAAIWNRERNEAPLKTMTRAQAEVLETAIEIGSLGFPEDRVRIAWAMRYGEPSIAEAIHCLQTHGCDRLLLVPLYPQYAAATSATVCDKAFEVLSKLRWQPSLRVAHPYYDQLAYIEALAASLRKELAKLDFVPEVILASFHGMPQAYADKGDPYAVQCAETWRLLRDAMGFSDDQFRLTFQSRFGPALWLKPYTDEMVKALAAQGVKRLAIITPGFSADCLETIEEIGIENRDYFLGHGGEKFARIHCLNESEEGMAVIFDLVKRELSGWV
jgi:protoporphyrin/coproporphyrin ferrochelatase